MERSAIESHPGKVKAAHRYEVIDGSTRSMQLVGKTVHFIGAGGVGMSGLARFLLEKKGLVSGSDQTGGAATARLSQLGPTFTSVTAPRTSQSGHGYRGDLGRDPREQPGTASWPASGAVTSTNTPSSSGS